jgi:hypothetical protein
VARVDVQDFVESPGDVKSHGIHVLKIHAAFNLLGGEPSFVREAKLQLVSVFIRFLASEDGRYFGQLDLADAREVVRHLLLLKLKLFFIGQALPLASATHGEVLARGFNSKVRLFVKAHDLGFSIAMLLLLDLKVNDIAWHAVGHENNQLIQLGNRLAFGGNARYGDVFY